MHACKRNLLALAVGAILLPAVALADKPTGVGQGNATSQAAQSSPHPSMPTPAVDHAGDALTRNPQYDPAVTREVGKNTPPASERPPAADDDDDDDDVADNDNDDDSDDVADNDDGDDNDNDNDDNDDDDANAGGTGSGRSTGSAAQTNPGKGNWWDDADGDDDGRISRAEAAANAGLNSRFATVDTNGDGYVTRDEYMTYYKANASQGAEHAADHSAVVATDLWRRFDANGDGRLSAVEIDLDARLKADFGAIDANDDGFVSDAEYRAYYRTD
jgi:hypothetical protein